MRSAALIDLANPSGLATRLVDYLAAYDIDFERRNGSVVADLGYGKISLAASDHQLDVTVEGRDAGNLEMLRDAVATYILDLSEEAPELRWTDCTAGRLFTNFREVVVDRVSDLTPHMRRLTVRGADLGLFASDADIHVRTYLPPPGSGAPQWPRLGANGRTLWPDAPHRPALRYYTLRRVDAAAGEIDLDVVLHAAPGPGAQFAAEARRGDVLGIAGPVGRTLGTATWYLLAGDETALPAIARILETMKPDAQGVALIEIDGPDEQITLCAPPGVTIRWLYRDGAAAADSARLLAAIVDVPWPDGRECFVWAGCEATIARRIRAHVETIHGVTRDRHLIIGYWSR